MGSLSLGATRKKRRGDKGKANERDILHPQGRRRGKDDKERGGTEPRTCRNHLEDENLLKGKEGFPRKERVR